MVNDSMHRSLTPLKITLPILLFALSACGASASKPVVEFPDREALAAIGQTPAGKLNLPAAAAPGGAWKVEQGLPATAGDEPWQPEGGLGEGLFPRQDRSSDHTADVKMLLTRVINARKRLGLSPPARLDTMDQVLKEELARVHEGKAQPMEAMEAVLQRGVGAFQNGMRGLVIEAASLDELELPAEFVRQGTLHLDIGVTHHKAPGAAWAQFAILVIWLDYTGREA